MTQIAAAASDIYWFFVEAAALAGAYMLVFLLAPVSASSLHEKMAIKMSN
jgi:hypothetical protein